MLKTNSKKARENIRAYIVDRFDPSNYDIDPAPETWEEIARCIMDTFHEEKIYSMENIRRLRLSEYDVFQEWTQGLPSILDTCYWYNRPAIDDLGSILEETAEEKARFNEESACILLTKLIYRELVRGCE